MTLFRLVEPLEGAITLDGQNILELGLEDVRSRIAGGHLAELGLHQGVRQGCEEVGLVDERNRIAGGQRQDVERCPGVRQGKGGQSAAPWSLAWRMCAAALQVGCSKNCLGLLLRELAIEGISCTAGEQGWCLTICLKGMLSYHMMLEDGT